ncbi:SusC/RagA family TonB-linked outer membrane protein [Pararcticibacter amylolyticus]|uniref:SusC/RagA family TonB-linked outer membrane protein n=1 Tax=Pararcticibacter amylolyticus TaxID=2173175 RepID=A0A2U2PBA3_9SPHI|nr:TonB-dependent receptor [Pararcticibacter amylolyticus]PWG78640.1 SusC/RagA family TonB-linked outer membrane protein [Pararcticibacter amylolyticus]
MNGKSTLFFLILYFIASSVLYAQEMVITGTVTSQKDGTGLPGVTVMIQGSKQGVSTDINGSFKITVPRSGTVLSFSQIGMESQTFTVRDNKPVRIALAEKANELSEVVVVGYGTQLRRAVTTAISSVKPEQITQTPVQRIEQALQGRIAGVQVSNVSGAPGEAPTVRIRGIGTNGDASPLYIVDGFQVNGIDYLNPADIQSMDVLKDAASTAIYGARGANGVVLITTKSGTKDGSMRIIYDGYQGVQSAWRKLHMLDAHEYAIMMNEGAGNAGIAPPFPDLSLYPAGYGTDWQKAIFDDSAPIMNHQLTVSGGTEKSNYVAAASIFDQTGLVGGDKSNFKRYTFRVNADNKVKDFLKIGTNIAYSQIKRKAFDPNQEFGGILSNALNLDPITPVLMTDPVVPDTYAANSVRNSDGVLYGISTRVAQEVVNPLARLAVTNGGTRVDKFVGNLSADLQIARHITFRSTFAADLAFQTDNNYSPLFYLNQAQFNNTRSVNKSVKRWYTWQTENYINYDNTFNKHTLNVTVGTTARKENFEDLFGSNTGLVVSDPSMAYLNLATGAQTATAKGGASEVALLSLFSRINYNYAGKYIFSATIRRDGSSRFGANNRYGTFPSVSGGWIFSEEGFFPKGKFVNYGKLRMSWGQNGNDRINDNYPWAPVISVGRGYSFGDGYQSGASPGYMANPDIKWEASEQTDIGLDLAFLNNRLSFSGDYYIKTTKDWLLTLPIPRYSGVPAGSGNGGSVRNSGIELALNFQQKINDWSISLGINGSYNKNEVTEINNAEKKLPGAGISTYGQVAQSTVGDPFSYFYGYKMNGIFQNQAEVDAYVKDGQKIQPYAQPGDVRFVDKNNDGKIDAADRMYLGMPMPDIFAGFNFNVSYKNFDLGGFFSGSFGNQIFNGIRRHDLKDANMSTMYLNRWTGEGSTNEMPRFTWNDANKNYTNISDLYLEDGDFVRLKTLQLGYNLGRAALSKIRLQKLRIYISGDNLITFTNYSGFDPEIGARTTLDIGIDRGVYPQSRTLRLGLNATF